MNTNQSQSVSIQEFSIRVPKNLKKKHHVMRFNGNLNVDFTQWRNVKMERENNLKEFKSVDEDTPKYGAGSEYNRELKEEVRRKKYGIIARKYRPEAQPWILKVGGKTGKKFRGIREGGVSDNASFYVFTHAPDGAIEAYPLNEWYNFQPIQRYKTLTAEEAEQELSNRKKALNLFALMLRKRMKGEEEEDVDLESEKKKGTKKKDFTISEMDEWIESDDDEGTEDDEKKNESDNDKDNKKKVKGPIKKKKRDVDDEAFEESDDGDEEGRELDYISDSSESDTELEVKSKELKSVAEEDAWKTSEEEDEDKKSGQESIKSDEENESKELKSDERQNKDKKKKKKHKRKGAEESASDGTSESSDSGNDQEKPIKKNKKKEKNLKAGNVSRPASPSSTQENMKRKASSMPFDLTTSENSNSPISTPSKKSKHDTPLLPHTFSGVTNSKEDYGITEEAVRRYLMRKPMTTIELLTKFKSKKTGVSSDKLVETMTQILKRINPIKQTIQGKMYLSIKNK